MTIRSRFNSIVHAIIGMIYLIRNEPNAQIHGVATLGVIIAGIVRHIGTGQWIAITIAIAMVWITEALNTCIELLCNYACKDEYHAAIKVIKDIAAASVWVAAIASIVIGIAVFFF